MIALDTNVLMRLLMRDDVKQSERARTLFEKHGEEDGAFFVSDIVLAELAWTLERAYQLGWDDIAKTVGCLLDNVTLVFESRETLRAALRLFAAKSAGFPDCMIVAKAAAAGCANVVTFDKGMRELPKVELL